MESIRVFGRATGERLALFCPQDWVYSDSDGLRVKEHIRQGDCTPTQGLKWTFACEMEGWPDAPDASTYAALPYPFNARQLAAFMLDGVGSDIALHFGEFDDDPDEDALQGLGIDAGHAREALRGAYEAIRQATARVGWLDNELQHRAYAARVSYGKARGLALKRERVMEPKDAKQTEADYQAEYRKRLKLAVDPLADLKAEASRLSAKADAAARKWRSDMVRALLWPEQTAPATEADQGAPVVTTNDVQVLQAKKRRDRKPSWSTVAMPYMRQLFVQGKYKSNAMFYKALVSKAGSEGSPFTKTTGGLFCTEAGTTVAEGSVGKFWVEIRNG